MFCPFCMSDVDLKNVVQSETGDYYCPECMMVLPKLFLNSEAYPPVYTGSIILDGQGSSTYFASLFYYFKHPEIINTLWRPYSFFINEEGLSYRLQKGDLPCAEPITFPNPMMVRLDDIPGLLSHTIVCYIVGAESFYSIERFNHNAYYNSVCKSVFLFLSIFDLLKEAKKGYMDSADRLLHLLNLYIMGMAGLNAETKTQHLIVVLTKADLLEWDFLVEYMNNDSYNDISSIQVYLSELKSNSKLLSQYISDELKAGAFIEMANNHFASVEFCIVSALGAKPDEDNRLTAPISPRRILDPLILQAEKLSLIDTTRLKF